MPPAAPGARAGGTAAAGWACWQTGQRSEGRAWFLRTPTLSHSQDCQTILHAGTQLRNFRIDIEGAAWIC